MNRILSNFIVFCIVLYVSIAVLRDFKFKYNSFWDWIFRRNPIIYYKGKALTEESK